MNWKLLLMGGTALASVGFLGCKAGSNARHPSEVLQVAGTVEMQEVHLGSRLGGRIADVRVEEGDAVSPGDVLVTFEIPEVVAMLDGARADLRAAQARHARAVRGPRKEEIEAARFAAAAAESHLRYLENGPGPAELEQARSSLSAAEALLEEAQQRLDRAQRLREKDAVSDEQVERAMSLWKRAHSEIAAARAHVVELEQGTRQELIEQGKAEVGRTQALYALAAAGTRRETVEEAQALVDAAESRVRQLEAQRSEAQVLAPDPGVIEVLPVRKGDLIQPNQPVLRFLRNDDLWVEAYVPATKLGFVQLHQEVEVTVDGYDDRPFSGTITHIANQGEFTPRNVQSVEERAHHVFGIRVRVEDSQGILKSGMAAMVAIPPGAKSE